MKSEEKIKQRQSRIQNSKENSSSLNQTLPACLNGFRSTKVSQKLTRSSQRRSLSSKLSKSLVEASTQLSYLVDHNMLQTKSNNKKFNLRPSMKQPTMSSFKPTRNKSIASNIDNLENEPTNTTKHARKRTTNKSTNRQTLNEKSLNSLMLNCFDEASNSSQASGYFSAAVSTVSSGSSEGLNTYSLNLKRDDDLLQTTVSDETANKVQLEKAEQEAKQEIDKLRNEKVNKQPQVVVPNFRVKLMRPRFNLEYTENTNDAIYTKRHQKFENEEIRIKKWDMKQQRDEYLKNKALQKENRQSSAASSTPISANSSPLKRFNATILNNPDQASEKFLLNEDNEDYTIQIIDETLHPEPIETTDPEPIKSNEPTQEASIPAINRPILRVVKKVKVSKKPKKTSPSSNSCQNTEINEEETAKPLVISLKELIYKRSWSSSLRRPADSSPQVSPVKRIRTVSEKSVDNSPVINSVATRSRTLKTLSTPNRPVAKRRRLNV